MMPKAIAKTAVIERRSCRKMLKRARASVVVMRDAIGFVMGNTLLRLRAVSFQRSQHHEICLVGGVGNAYIGFLFLGFIECLDNFCLPKTPLKT